MRLRAKSFLRSATDHIVNENPRLRMLLLDLFFPDRDQDIELCGSRLRINARKESGFLRAAKLAQSNWVLRHELGVLTTLACLLESTDTFVDIGANIGLYASLISRAGTAFPMMKFYAFEPNPDTLKRLRESLADTRVQIFGCALSDREAEMEFCQGAGSATFGIKKESRSGQINGQTVRIKAVRLDSVRIEGDSIVLKIDVEGHEAEVLRGAQQLFNSGRVKAVYVDSFEDKTIPGSLRTMGFQLFDGHTLKCSESSSSLLAIHDQHLARWAGLRPSYAAG
jgi:FkbM family methyltransferase